MNEKLNRYTDPVKWWPYALGVPAALVVGWLEYRLESYGLYLGVKHVSDMGPVFGLVFASMLDEWSNVSKAALFFALGSIVVLFPPIAAFIYLAIYKDGGYGIHLWLELIDLAIGVLTFFLVLPIVRLLKLKANKQSSTPKL